MHTLYVSPGKDFFVCKNKREDALQDGQPVYRHLPIVWLRLNEKGNAERGGYMWHIYRCFAIHHLRIQMYFHTRHSSMSTDEILSRVGIVLFYDIDVLVCDAVTAMDIDVHNMPYNCL